MDAVLKLRASEAALIEAVFADKSLDKVIKKALEMGLTFDDLTIDRVTVDGPWVSTAKSTIPVAVLYFKNYHLITRRLEEERYTLFKYRWRF